MTDATWGAVVDPGDGFSSRLNLPGCVALRGDVTCATALEDLDACLGAACDGPCPVTTLPTFLDNQSCRTLAQPAGCKTYDDKVKAACNGDAATPYQLCAVQSFQAGYFSYAPLFCSGGG